MDEIVARAMQKWPNVPDVYGWLRLDRRGTWWLKSGLVKGRAPSAAWLDEHGALVVATALGPGLLNDRDLAALADAFVDARGARIEDDPAAHAARGDLRVAITGVSLPVQPLVAAEAPLRFGFDPAPAPPPGQPDC